jgi:hypothetical protein
VEGEGVLDLPGARSGRRLLPASPVAFGVDLAPATLALKASAMTRRRHRGSRRLRAE